MSSLLQLPLSISTHGSLTFVDFYVGDNQQAIAAVKKLAAGAGEKFIYLWGGHGVGLSHILQAASHSADEQGHSSAYLPMKDFCKMSPSILDGLEQMSLLCIDNIDAIAQLPNWEEAVFHLYNKIRDSGNCLLVAANSPPRQLTLALADLRSRLSSGLVFQIQMLSDDQKITVLQRGAARRGLHLSYNAGQFMLRRCPRDMAALLAALDVLDRASLIAQRRLTIPFMKETLGL